MLVHERRCGGEGREGRHLDRRRRVPEAERRVDCGHSAAAPLAAGAQHLMAERHRGRTVGWHAFQERGHAVVVGGPTEHLRGAQPALEHGQRRLGTRLPRGGRVEGGHGLHLLRIALAHLRHGAEARIGCLASEGEGLGGETEQGGVRLNHRLERRECRGRARARHGGEHLSLRSLHHSPDTVVVHIARDGHPDEAEDDLGDGARHALGHTHVRRQRR
mmetsp:Transcript_24637/g.67016  ORF Transcript_24637/g.67016 Transcript_24637/m.67016 type:complete len:218 (-) Transcript_24637:1738-2391(-)